MQIVCDQGIHLLKFAVTNYRYKCQLGIKLDIKKEAPRNCLLFLRTIFNPVLAQLGRQPCVYQLSQKRKRRSLKEIAFGMSCPFRAPARFLLASPSDPWSRQIALSGLPAGS